MSDRDHLTPYDEQRLEGYLTSDDALEDRAESFHATSPWEKASQCLTGLFAIDGRRCSRLGKCTAISGVLTLLLIVFLLLRSGAKEGPQKAPLDVLISPHPNVITEGKALKPGSMALASEGRLKHLEEGMALCSDPDFTKTTLKTVYEEAFFGLLENTRGERKFEASDVAYHNGSFWVVADNSWAVGHFGRRLRPFASNNIQIGDAKRKGHGDSQWEGLVFDTKRKLLLAVREEIEVDKLREKNLYIPDGKKAKGFRSVIQELRLKDFSSEGSDKLPHDYDIEGECVADYHFDYENKGFEGAIGVRSKDGELYVLGLCEGNFCKGKDEGRRAGNGRMVLLKRKEKKIEKTSICYWETVREINLPSEIFFSDYSAAALDGDRLAVVSQENAAVWIGQVSLGDNDDFDPEEFKVKSGGRIYNFPRDEECNVVYCNVEGIAFVEKDLLVAVSDKMKARGRQDFRCLAKDQSLHVFAVPQ